MSVAESLRIRAIGMLSCTLCSWLMEGVNLSSVATVAGKRRMYNFQFAQSSVDSSLMNIGKASIVLNYFRRRMQMN